MFSRGNISEKGRLLSLAELTPPVLGAPPADCTAVDLYAGIGYFAFCYTRAGVGRVLCWELNAWSVEGLRRGAAANGWAVGVWSADVAVDAGAMAWDDAVDDVGVMERRIVVFPENNERAAGRVAAMRRQLPPVRHVNCGFLPSSRDSWGTAVRVLDPGLGGWVHAHENIASGEIEERRKEIVGIFDVLANGGSIAPVYQVHCQHLERVKSYAPGVIHCVLDICIAPLRGIGSEL
jgi:tRNA wybutosine-synthesizing protein 2